MTELKDLQAITLAIEAMERRGEVDLALLLALERDKLRDEVKQMVLAGYELLKLTDELDGPEAPL